jgi:hypothetical protein
MGVFYLKYRDTKPKLIATLKNPDGTIHNLTGITDVKLQIKLADGTALQRNMTIEGAPTLGTVGYSWLATDWNVGGLVAGKHDMEYESVAERLTFPNDSYDELLIKADIGQG